MENAFLEIVELEDGQFALKRIDSDDEALVTVNFSAEVIRILQDNQSIIAKAMIGAGVQAASMMSQQAADDTEELSSENQTIH
jgi:hypothetical protein